MSEDKGWFERQAKRTAEDIKTLPDWLRTESADPTQASAARLTAIAARLREAVTVLDEPFHRESVSGLLLEAAAALDTLRQQQEWLRRTRIDDTGSAHAADLDALQAERDEWKLHSEVRNFRCDQCGRISAIDAHGCCGICGGHAWPV